MHRRPEALTNGFSVGYLIGAGLCAVAAVLTFMFPSPRAVPSGAERRRTADQGLGGGRPRRSRSRGRDRGVFARVEFIVPRSHGAPIGKYVVKRRTRGRSVRAEPASAEVADRRRDARHTAPRAT